MHNSVFGIKLFLAIWKKKKKKKKTILEQQLKAWRITKRVTTPSFRYHIKKLMPKIRHQGQRLNETHLPCWCYYHRIFLCKQNIRILKLHVYSKDVLLTGSSKSIYFVIQTLLLMVVFILWTLKSVIFDSK